MMRGVTLRGFFEGSVTTLELERELEGAWKSTGAQSRRLVWSDIDTPFEVTPQHLAMLCEAVLIGALKPEGLEAVAACLFASEHFTWDVESPAGERVATTVDDWVSPELAYALSTSTVEKFLQRLRTGEDHFTRGDLSSSQRPA